MIGKPLVSVIIPFLNAERFIDETIVSVFAQTYNNWELLLADDGSTDGSTEIARRYAQQNPEKAYYLEHQAHQNRGQSASRNLGLRHAQGNYIAFLDADDIWLPQKLHQQVGILESHPEAGMTYGLSQWWYSWTGNAGDSQRDFVQSPSAPANTLCKPPKLLSLFLRQQTAVPVPGAILVKRDVIERIGGWEEANRTPYDDQAFYAKICLEASVFVENECYCKYRKHPDSLCAVMKSTGQHHAVRLAFLNWLEEYMSKQQVQNEEVWEALNQELWPYRHPILQRMSKAVRYRVRRIEMLPKLVAQRIIPKRIHQRLRTRWQRQAG